MGGHGPDLNRRVRVGPYGFSGCGLRFQQVFPQRLGAGLATAGKHHIESWPGVQFLVKESPHSAVIQFRGAVAVGGVPPRKRSTYLRTKRCRGPAQRRHGVTKVPDHLERRQRVAPAKGGHLLQ